MDAFGLDNSMLIDVQLKQFQTQFKNACKRLNITAIFEKPVKLWLIENLRGQFKTRNDRTGFKFEKRYNMMWELKIDRNDIKFIVDFDNEVFDAIEPFFRIVERDKEIIVGSFACYQECIIHLRRYLSYSQWSLEEDNAGHSRFPHFLMTMLKKQIGH